MGRELKLSRVKL